MHTLEKLSCEENKKGSLPTPKLFIWSIESHQGSGWYEEPYSILMLERQLYTGWKRWIGMTLMLTYPLLMTLPETLLKLLVVQPAPWLWKQVVMIRLSFRVTWTLLWMRSFPQHLTLSSTSCWCQGRPFCQFPEEPWYDVLSCVLFLYGILWVSCLKGENLF